MYICPFCKKEIEDEAMMSKHYLACWRATHTVHQSNPAPRSEDIEKRVVNDYVTAFFNDFRKGAK